jgi:putative DNA primase/helicase
VRPPVENCLSPRRINKVRPSAGHLGGRREAYEAAVRCFQDWLSERETAGPSDDEKAVQQVRLFLERHGASRFQLTWDAADEEAAEKQEELAIRDRAGFRRRGEDGQIEYLVFPETFRKEVCAGLAWKPVLKVLHSRKFLRNDEGHMTRVARLPQLGLRRVYCICSLIFDAPPKKDGEEET